jgi:hypothetical protein
MRARVVELWIDARFGGCVIDIVVLFFVITGIVQALCRLKTRLDQLQVSSTISGPQLAQVLSEFEFLFNEVKQYNELCALRAKQHTRVHVRNFDAPVLVARVR